MKNNVSINNMTGTAVFALGILLLLTVFFLGYNMYVNDFISVDSIKERKAIEILTEWGVSFVIKSVSLLIMTVAASCLTNKGIDIMFRNRN